jgi:hypothetical protein
MDLRGSSSLYASGSRVSNIPPAPLRRRRYEKILLAMDRIGINQSFRKCFHRTINLLLSLLVEKGRSTGESGGRGEGRSANDESKESKGELHCFCQILEFRNCDSMKGTTVLFLFWLSRPVLFSLQQVRACIFLVHAPRGPCVYRK